MRIIPADDRIGDCIAVRTAVFVGEQGIPEELEVDDLDSPFADCEHFLILDGDKPVGTFRAYPESEDTVHLQRLCVLREYRGLGYGRAALSFTREHFRKKGFRRIVFGAQETAIGFYEKCGCRVISDTFLDAGLPHRTMELKI